MSVRTWEVEKPVLSSIPGKLCCPKLGELYPPWYKFNGSPRPLPPSPSAQLPQDLLRPHNSAPLFSLSSTLSSLEYSGISNRPNFKTCQMFAQLPALISDLSSFPSAAHTFQVLQPQALSGKAGLPQPHSTRSEICFVITEPKKGLTPACAPSLPPVLPAACPHLDGRCVLRTRFLWRRPRRAGQGLELPGTTCEKERRPSERP